MAALCQRLENVGYLASRPMSLRVLPFRIAPLRSFHAGPPTTDTAATSTTSPYNCRFIFRNSNNLPFTLTTNTAATAGCMSSTSLGLLKKLVSRTSTQTPTAFLKPNPQFLLSQARTYTTFKDIMSGLFPCPRIENFNFLFRTKENQSKQSSRRTRWRRTNQSHLGHDQETTHSPIFGYRHQIL
jgi:hypothetical protein